MTYTIPLADLGHCLREMRRHRGMGLTAMSSRTGLARQTLWSLEKGKTRLRIDTLDRLAHALGMGRAEVVIRLSDEDELAFDVIGSSPDSEPSPQSPPYMG
jgi:transcriptional regulator with XRE-family HTH domain